VYGFINNDLDTWFKITPFFLLSFIGIVLLGYSLKFEILEKERIEVVERMLKIDEINFNLYKWGDSFYITTTDRKYEFIFKDDSDYLIRFTELES
jgi:hypothetical protein